MEKINIGDTMGVRRKLDELGRITVPMEFRKTLNLDDRAEVEIFLLKNGIFVKTK